MFFLLSIESLFFRRKKIDLALDLDRDLALDRARALFLKEIDYISGKGREESEANLLYVDGLEVEGVASNPFLKFLYDSSVDERFVEKFYETLLDVDKQKFEERSLAVHIKYLEDALAGELESIDVARVIVLGNGNAGKTSLIKKLANSSTVTTKEETTPYIAISHQKVGEVEVDYWDFGGQVFMHSTHIFFMTSKATYIIVCNARADEQPDNWLETLKQKFPDAQGISVLVVYTHVDSKEEREGFDKFRKNTLRRKYGALFDLSFHLHSSEKVHSESYNELNSRLAACIKKEGLQKTLKEIADIYKDAKKALATAEDIHKKCKDFIKDDDGTALIKELMLIGYIFPLKALKLSEYKYHKDDRFVWQKHWLTYGVYTIINHPKTKKQKGYVFKSDFKSMLFNEKKRYILPNGKLQKTKPKRKPYETIVYDDAGIDALYEIVQNYKWAIVNAGRYDGMIFPHAVSLDEPEDSVLSRYMGIDDESIVLNVLMDTVPLDFFFRFVKLADTHIHDPNLLWRNGVVLFDQMDRDSSAYVQMHSHKIEIVINGKWSVKQHGIHP